MRIILVGFMGCGKSTFGRKLEKKLKLPFIDSDMEIILNESKSINKLFEELGEQKFRDLESEFINSLTLSDSDFILSTGGGLPCFNDNMEALNKLGTTVYIQMSPKAIFKRLENGKEERPLLRNLSDDKMLSYIEENLEIREAFYSKANIILPGLSLNAKVMDKLIEEIYSK